MILLISMVHYIPNNNFNKISIKLM